MNGSVLLIVPSEHISRVLEIAGLDQAFKLRPSPSEAVAAACGIAAGPGGGQV